MDEVIQKLASRDNSAPDDYTENGIRMCGKCHTPKQAWIDIDGDPRLVPVTCKCAQARMEQEEAARRKTEFTARMTALQEAYEVSDMAFRADTFERDDRLQPKLSDACRRYVDQWETMKANSTGLLFYGTVGTGKSFFAGAITNALLEKCVPATVTNFPRLLNILQSERNRQQVIDHLRAYHLLVIDDLGVERDSTYAAEQIYGVIDARVRSRLPLIVTTNLTMDEFTDAPSMQFKRIYDRVLEACPVTLKLLGESRRVSIAAVRGANARKLMGLDT